jgi:hypothetical protein
MAKMDRLPPLLQQQHLVPNGFTATRNVVAPHFANNFVTQFDKSRRQNNLKRYLITTKNGHDYLRHINRPRFCFTTAKNIPSYRISVYFIIISTLTYRSLSVVAMPSSSIIRFPLDSQYENSGSSSVRSRNFNQVKISGQTTE